MGGRRRPINRREGTKWKWRGSDSPVRRSRSCLSAAASGQRPRCRLASVLDKGVLGELLALFFSRFWELPSWVPLNEPSAHLDSEQRLLAAKVIKRFILHQKKTAFIVEHDFIMAAYLADKVLVFEGKPSVDCTANAPESLASGMNRFLSHLDVTFRTDPTTYRPQINKLGSMKDTEQKVAAFAKGTSTLQKILQDRTAQQLGRYTLPVYRRIHTPLPVLTA